MKKIFTAFIISISLFVSCSMFTVDVRDFIDNLQQNGNTGDSPPPVVGYAIGDTGPGGGIVFQVGAVGNGNTYKEVSERLLDAAANTMVWDRAKEVSQNYSSTTATGTYDDWYLPNETELNDVYDALKKDKDPPLITEIGWLWSSTENSNLARRQSFNNGSPSYDYKSSSTNGVRAIRFFSL